MAKVVIIDLKGKVSCPKETPETNGDRSVQLTTKVNQNDEAINGCSDNNGIADTAELIELELQKRELLYHIGRYNDNVDNIQKKINAVEDEIGTMEDEIDTMEAEICTIEGKIDTMEDEIDTMEDDTEIITSTIGELKDIVDVINDKIECLSKKSPEPLQPKYKVGNWVVINKSVHLIIKIETRCCTGFSYFIYKFENGMYAVENSIDMVLEYQPEYKPGDYVVIDGSFLTNILSVDYDTILKCYIYKVNTFNGRTKWLNGSFIKKWILDKIH